MTGKERLSIGLTTFFLKRILLKLNVNASLPEHKLCIAITKRKACEITLATAIIVISALSP